MFDNSIFIHPTAIVENTKIGINTKIWAYSHVSKDVIIGDNCVIGEGVYIGPNVKIGNNVKIQNHSLIYEGVTIEDDVFMGPNVITTNDLYPDVSNNWSHRFRTTLFKKGCSIGANSTIICGIEIGENTLIGAGSVVTKSFPKNLICFGNPCKKIKNK
jgi:UDP-2-acetamido-3-amino-2,3-dideoxy-glucuronate N-acetyltransferase